MADITMRIIGEDKASGAFSAVRQSVQSFGKESSSAMEMSAMSAVKLAGSYLGIQASIETVVSAIKQMVVESTLLAARISTLNVVLEAVGTNAGKSNKYMHDTVEGVKKMGITTQEATTSVIRMTQAQMNLDEASALARVAQDAAVIGNINSSEAFSRIIAGIQRGETEILKTIGLNVDFEGSHQRLAMKLNKSTEALTEQEKVQARTNEAFRVAARYAGVYGGAMDTAGKQMRSLSRYSDEVKEKIGSVFEGAFGDAIKHVTEGLKYFSKTLDELKADGTLAEWANNARAALGMLSVAFDTIKTAATGFFTVVSKISATVFAAPLFLAKKALSLFRDEEAEKQKKFIDEKNKEFLDRIQKAKAAKAAAENVPLITKAQMDAATKGMNDFVSVVDKLGSQQIKLAGGYLSQKINQNIYDIRQLSVAYHELSEQAQTAFGFENQIVKMEALEDAYKNYHDIVAEAYRVQLDEQKKILDIMGTYEKRQSVIARQAVQVKETEIRLNQEKLQSYQQYYDQLKKVQDYWYNAAVKATKDIADLEKQSLKNRLNFANSMQSIQDKVNPAANQLDQWYRDYDRTMVKIQQAFMQTGEDRKQALASVVKDAENLVRQVDWTEIDRKMVMSGQGFGSTTDWQDVTINKTMSIGETAQKVMPLIVSLYQAIDKEIAESKTTAENNRATALQQQDLLTQKIRETEHAMEGVRQTLIDLDLELAKTRVLSIDVSGAIDAVRGLRYELLSALNLQTMLGVTAGINGVIEAAGPAQHGGTAFISRTGLYPLLQGEEVRSRREVDRSTNGQPSMQVGTISINIPSGDPDIIARDLVKAVEREQRKMRALGA